MGSVERIKAGELVEDIDDFFAPMASDLVDSLVGEYDATRKRLENMASAVSSGACRGVLHYFVEGNVQEQRHSMPTTVDALFRLAGAVGQLNADFWNRALRLTDVFDYMPQKRREEWSEQIRNPLGKKKHRSSWDKDAGEWEVAPLPEFEEDSVRATLSGLLASRAKFLAERVDGIFRSLSRQHVTNQPQGFSKRMIIAGVHSYGTAGHINDLRSVIAKFMGRDEPRHGTSDPIIKAAGRQNGQWMTIDGGALRIRVYGGVGTAHLEVHPDMAWRLNAILASLYPAAIPAELRERPNRKKKIKDFELFDRPLPFTVVNVLAGMKEGWEKKENPGYREHPFRNVPRTRRYDHYGDSDKATMAAVASTLTAIGGVWVKEHGYWRFDYEPADILDQIVCSGCIPDHKSHQFYPTPASVAEKAIELADIQPGHVCLEPSAGQGGLADLMPKDSTTCVEISELHCKILEAKGHKVVEADFLKVAGLGKFDRIVMNPPFSEGRWQAHLKHAAVLLSDIGRLVAILPASAKGKDLLPGFTQEWSLSYANEFAGTSVSVVILVAQRELN
ncbi:DUF4942 domain-containing protein [Pseudomonas putida]|uniref:DUF4942 domain-containing protein n=1 Tax=Pseudomonas putida TaxID=303 RepID=A0A6S5TUX9_PSEPU|nr:DUF4942 domain-containing protein [Pseudomonas putida]BBT40929.1 hypothetical protein WP8W18C01_32700 [Pseudomonas putida]BBT41056.1 hypothetical protein WP8W18C01_33970 [Pseudomonas putida]